MSKSSGPQDEKQKHDSESRALRDLKGTGEDVRRHRGDKERGEPDKHKERRRREEEEEEEQERNHHRDRTSSKNSASDKSRQKETKTEVCMRVRCISIHFNILYMVLY